MKRICTLLLPTLFSSLLSAQNAAPIVSNLSVTPDIVSGTAALSFVLADAENDPLEVTLQFSSNGGKTYTNLAGANVTGDVGFPILAGARQINCTGLNFANPGKYAFRVIADDKQPIDIQALVNEVDSTRLRSDLEFLEGVRHRATGLAHLNETRVRLQNHFESNGLFFENHSFTYTNSVGQNLIGSLAGTASAEKVVVVDAHYDTVSNAPGADDNGSGTVGVMEIARILSRYPSKKTQRYIGFDLEEAGLVGSTRYVTNAIPATEQIEGVLNFEMIGYWSDQPNTQELPTGFGLLFPVQEQQVIANQYRGDFISNVGNTNSQALALLFSTAAQQYVPDLKVITLDVPGNGQLVPDLRRSDHTPFWESNRQALMLTDGANFRNECYHTPGDTLNEKLNFTFMSNVVKATLATMAQLVELQHAGYSTATIQVGVATHEPGACQFKVWQQGSLFIQSEGCGGEVTNVEIFDMKGALQAAKTLSIAPGAIAEISLLGLPSGVYALKISGSGGVFSQKVIID